MDGNLTLRVVADPNMFAGSELAVLICGTCGGSGARRCSWIARLLCADDCRRCGGKGVVYKIKGHVEATSGSAAT